MMKKCIILSMKSSSGGDFWKNFSLRGDFTPAQERGVIWLPKRKEGSKIKDERFPGFFRYHAIYSCKTSTLYGTVSQFNQRVLWLELYILCINISVLSLSLT